LSDVVGPTGMSALLCFVQTKRFANQKTFSKSLPGRCPEFRTETSGLLRRSTGQKYLLPLFGGGEEAGGIKIGRGPASGVRSGFSWAGGTFREGASRVVAGFCRGPRRGGQRIAVRPIALGGLTGPGFFRKVLKAVHMFVMSSKSAGQAVQVGKMAGGPRILPRYGAGRIRWGNRRPKRKSGRPLFLDGGTAPFPGKTRSPNAVGVWAAFRQPVWEGWLGWGGAPLFFRPKKPP